MTPESHGAAVRGLENLLHSDDGLGIPAIDRLRKDPRVDSDVTLLDGGTQGLNLIPHIWGFQRILVIDAVDVGQAPGTLVRFHGTALDGLPGKPSVHQLGFADLMVAMKLLGAPPEEVVVLGVQPESTGWGAELTPPVQIALLALLDAVIAQLAAWANCEPLESC